jgi:hypothetical protein
MIFSDLQVVSVKPRNLLDSFLRSDVAADNRCCMSIGENCRRDCGCILGNLHESFLSVVSAQPTVADAGAVSSRLGGGLSA